MTTIGVASNLRRVKEAIQAAAVAAGREPLGVTLVAVSKTQPREVIRPVLASGHRCFGENRVQEAQEKWPFLRLHFPGIQLHLIGPLQTNKVREALGLFDVIETLDRPRLAEALARERDRVQRMPRFYIQVNTGHEPQKAGVIPEGADSFIAQCRDEFGLEVEGLMCIPPVDQDPAPHFALLAEIAARNGLSNLSMGMSGDFEVAIRHGATHVRVGTAIFGERSTNG